MNKENDPKTVCALVSGGVDSSVLVSVLLDEGATVEPVYVKTEMVWEEVEQYWLEQYLNAIASPKLHPLRAISLPLKDVYLDHWSVTGTNAPGYNSPDPDVYLPGRNVVLIAKTAIYCALNRIPQIDIALLAGNPFPDATDAFFNQLARSLTLALNWPITIDRPFKTLEKSEVIRRGIRLPLNLTFSCIRPVDGIHCGNCNKCAERQNGFRDAGVPDLTTYATNPVDY